MSQPPPCNSKYNRAESRPKRLGKSKKKFKSQSKNARPTKTAGNLRTTLPPFDFKAYLREKDNRDFKLLIDQPEKCHLEEEESRKGFAAAPYMLIAVKSVAADFDKRQVT